MAYTINSQGSKGSADGLTSSHYNHWGSPIGLNNFKQFYSGLVGLKNGHWNSLKIAQVQKCPKGSKEI